MRATQKVILVKRSIATLSILLLLVRSSAQIPIKEFVIFGNTGVQAGSSTVIVNGKTGSNTLIQTTGTSQIGGNLYSNGQIILANSNTVSGKMYIKNATNPTTGFALQVGSNTNLTDTIISNWSVSFSGGTVNGPVYYQGTYSGTPAIRPALPPTPAIPTLPSLPTVINKTFDGTATITTTQSIGIGAYKAMMLGGAQTITFTTPGEYRFDSIKNSGNFNKLVFTFNTSNDRYRIYVKKNVELYKINIAATGTFGATMTNSDIASRIIMQVEGDGRTSSSGDAWSITNGASGNNQSTWLGTVYAPNGNIDVGSGSQQSKIFGALWSGKKVIVQSGVSISFIAFEECSPVMNAGADKVLDCDNTTATLAGTVSGSGQTYSWSKVGGTLTGTTNQASIIVNKPGTYVLTATSTECINPATDTVVVTANPCVFPFYPPPGNGKVNNKIGSELTSLYNNYGSVVDSGKVLFVIVNDSVLIDVIAKPDYYSIVLDSLQHSLGGTRFISNGSNSIVITCFIPIANLNRFDIEPLRSMISFVRPAYPPVSNAGLILSQGDRAMKTDLVRNAYDLSGDSIKVGVISDSYNTLGGLANDLGNGDLVASQVEVVQEYPFGSRGDEGRAMMQIVHDVAPGSKLAFRTGFITAGDMAEGIRELVRRKCDIIVDDITYITEPFFRNGPIADAMHYAAQNGVHYLTAAGNFAMKSYEGDFTPSATPLPAGITGLAAHDYGGSIFQLDSVKGSDTQPGVYTLVLQWQNDYYSLGGNPGAGVDLDAYAFDNMGNTIGFNRINIDGDPTEVLTFFATRNTVVNIMIVNANNISVPVHFKYVVFRGDFKINNFNQGFSTIVGPANSPDAITVGAAFYDYTPAFHHDSVITAFQRSSYSSVGGTWFNGANARKPDLMGPSGVNTSVAFGSIDYEHDLIPNFFGTSAAAPHVAGAIALLAEARRKFYRDTLTTDSVKRFLQRTALDMATPGFDYHTGAGYIRLDSALHEIANPTPRIDSIRLQDSSKVVGVQTVNVIISGSFINSETKVLLNNDTLSSVLTNSQLIAEVPPFNDTGRLYLYNEPITPQGNDAGLSDPKLLKDAKKVVKVMPYNQHRKYGENNPVLTYHITVDDQPNTLPLDSLGLVGLQIITSATPTSDVGIYFIRPVKNFDSTNATDAAWLAKFDYHFIDSALVIEKMPLVITPNTVNVNYGDAITNITYNYQYDQTNVSSTTHLLDTIKLYHQAFTPGNVLAVISDYASFLNNGSLTTNDIAHMNMIASFQALMNARKFDIVNNKLVSAADPTRFNLFRIIDVSAQSLVNFKTDPSTANFVSAYPGISSKAIVSENRLADGIAKTTTNKYFINGAMVQSVPYLTNTLAPVANTSLVQMVGGIAVRIENGQIVPDLTNTQLVQMVGTQLVQLVGGEWVAVPSTQLVQLVGTQLVQMVGTQLVQLVGGTQVPIPNGTDVTSVTIINADGTTTTNYFANGVQLQNTQLVQLVGTQLVQMVGNILAPLPSTSLVQMVGSSLVQMVGSQYVKVVNSGNVSGINNSTAVIVDANDAAGNGYLNALIGVNMITGLNVGLQKLVPGVFINKNFDVTYNVGTVNINAVPITIKANPATKVYGDTLVFTGDEYAITSGSLNPGEAIDSVTLVSNGVKRTASVGNYTLSPIKVFGVTGTDMNNYAVTYVSDNLSVTQRPITVTADAKTKVYGDNDPALTKQVTSGNLVNGDVLSGSLTRDAGQNAGIYAIRQGTLTAGSNYNLSYVGNNLTITKATLSVKANDATKQFGDPIPTLTASYTGFKYSDATATNIISGSPVITTTATAASIPGTYPINIDSGTISAANYYFNGFLPGTLTVVDKTSCILTHSKVSNFGSTPTGYVSLWLNIEIKVSGQLANVGDYIMFSGGSIALSNITYTSGNNYGNFTVKRGVIIADNVSAPITYFDAVQDMFITKVPVGFSSTSDIFISGVILTSSNGFTAGRNSSSTLKGAFYSNRSFSDQWNYAMAAYKKSTATYVTYSELMQFSPPANLASPIVSINGSYKAGTPMPWLSYIVAGGSGNGGNNYTGSSSSNDNFTACQPVAPIVITMQSNGALDDLSANDDQALKPFGLQVFPNPVSGQATISFIPETSGHTRVLLYNVNGMKIRELFNGSAEGGKSYVQKLNTINLPGGIYYIHLQNGDKWLVKKIAVIR